MLARVCRRACTRAGTGCPRATAPGPCAGEEQRRVVAPDPLQDLRGRVRVGPRLGRGTPRSARRWRTRSPCPARSRRSTTTTSWPWLREIPGGGGADDTGAQDEDFHRGRSARSLRYTLRAMRTRMYADLLGFVRAACTHASHAGRELPALPFYVKEHVVGMVAALLRRPAAPLAPRLRGGRSASSPSGQPDTPRGARDAMARSRELARDGVITRLARRAGERRAAPRRSRSCCAWSAPPRDISASWATART
mgnify:CR=1 FL=1